MPANTTLRTFCRGLCERAQPLDEMGEDSWDSDATEYVVDREDIEDLREIAKPLPRPPEVDCFFRGDALTGKTKEVIRKYIERLES